MNNNSLLIVEDDADIREILTFNLEDAGFSVQCSISAEDALDMIGPKTSLIILDVMLPGMSGYQLAHRLRQEGNNVPIIFLTARTSENDVLTGFSAGGDDYIQKPFSLNEVLARVKAVLKRSKSDNSFITIGSLTIDTINQVISIEGDPIELTKKEYDLFILLASKPGTFFTRQAIIDELWQDAPYVVDRTIDVHFARIRTKFGSYRDIIKNKSGFGYFLDSSITNEKDKLQS